VNDDSSKRTHFNPRALLGFIAICAVLGVFVSLSSRSLDGASAFLYVGLYGVAVLNVAVTCAIAVNDGLHIRQKVGQALVVWLIPVLGGLAIGVFMWTQRGSVPPSGYPGDTGPGPRNIYLGSHPPGPPGGC
jgi:H+/Cl- antiporter ClcA